MTLSQPRLIYQTAIVFAARFGGAVSGFLAMLIIARLLGAQALATVSIALSMSLLLSVMCTLSVEAGGVRIMIPALQRDDHALASDYIRFSRRFFIVMSGLTCLTGLIIVTALAPPERFLPLMLAVLSAPLLGALRIGSGYAMGFSSPLRAVLPRTFLRPAVFCLLLWLGTVMPGNLVMSPARVMLAFALACGLVLGVQYLSLRPLQRQLRPDRLVLSPRAIRQRQKTWITTGLTLGLNLLYLEYATAIAVLVASFQLAPGDLAAFDICLRIIGFLRFGLVAINQVVMPSLATAMNQTNTLEVARLMRLSAGLRLAIWGCGALVLILFGERILGAFDPQFIHAFPILLLLLAEPLIMTVFGPGANVVSLSRTPQILFRQLLLTLPTLVISVALLSQWSAITGAACGFVLARLSWDAGLSRAARRLTGINPTLSALWAPQMQPVTG